MDEAALPAGWEQWSEEPASVVLAYRPDVFDGSAFPAPCMPTIYLTQGERSRRPGPRRVGDAWHVTLYLEPEVELATRSAQRRDRAREQALSLARSFAAGELDYRGAYHQPRKAYLDELDELTGRRD